jgi:hypothetical protein
VAANTWGEWWKAMYEVIKNQYSKEDISAIEGLLRLNWNAATKAAVENLQQTTNSDYAEALKLYDEYIDHETTSRYSLPNFREWLKQRINLSTPLPECDCGGFVVPGFVCTNCDQTWYDQ